MANQTLTERRRTRFALLEKGTIQIPPVSAQQPALKLSGDVLLMLVESIYLASIKRRPSYPPASG